MVVKGRDSIDPLTNNDLMPSRQRSFFEIIVRKGQNPGKQHFLFFPQCFLPFERQFECLE